MVGGITLAGSFQLCFESDRNETMARIKIEELPVMEDLSEKEIKGIFGGAITSPALGAKGFQFGRGAKGFQSGYILHLVEDSYAAGHTVRAAVCGQYQ